jgi:hypothetical protein
MTTVSGNVRELERVTRTVSCTLQSVGLVATTLPTRPTKFLRGLLMLASGQSPKGYTALHRGQLAGAASTLWEHVTINMDMRKKAATDCIVKLRVSILAVCPQVAP